MSRMLHHATLCSQWVSHSLVGSMQHERDMGTAVGADRRVADRGADMLARYEKAYLSGYLPALAEALNICHFWRLPPPRWLVDAVTTTTTERMTKIEKKRHCENMKHYTRWLEVTYLRLRRHELGGMTWNECYTEVSEFLKNTEWAGPGGTISADTVKDSYVYVQGEIKAGRIGPFVLGHGSNDEPDLLNWPTRHG